MHSKLQNNTIFCTCGERMIPKNHKDMTKQQYLEKLGYQYINLWETDIHNAQYVHNELKIFFKSFLNLFEWESCSI